ncbi:MAG: lipocalin family protein [Tannerellaceae bacterium]|nr:lipocalin family protein [Tannerellaceae bacterium]
MNHKYALAGGAVLAIGTVLLLNSCKTIPKGVEPVQGFQKEKYLGKWFEIARLDYRFERNLKNVTADYTLNEDGSIKVVNRGYNYKKEKVEEAIGKAKFVDSPNIGKLKVSFFGPFYSGYNVIAIDEDYRYVLVAGKSHRYLWLLSRETTMPEDVKQAYLKKAQSLGYDITRLTWTEQDW